jgi:hypothetical protein
MSREHARPQSPAPGRQPPAGVGTEEGQRSQPQCRSGPPATEHRKPEMNPAAQWRGARGQVVGRWTPRTTPSPQPSAQPSSSLDPGRGRGAGGEPRRTAANGQYCVLPPLRPGPSGSDRAAGPHAAAAAAAGSRRSCTPLPFLNGHDTHAPRTAKGRL